MTKLVFHPKTQENLNRLAHNLPQSLLLSGQRGVGLMSAATLLADKNLAGEIYPLDAKGQRDDENGTIAVETIRRLYEQTRAKFTTRQIFIIDNAERMSRGASNAFLKLLEEPNKQIYFILTSHQPQQLLPTIRSRLQHTTIQLTSAGQSTEFITKLGITDDTKKAQLQFIAAGLPAELVRLKTDEAYFKMRAAIFSDARNFLQADTYKKLLVIQKYKTSRTDALQLCNSALYILRRSVSSKPQPELIAQLDQLSDTKERIAANYNIALQLARFVV